MKHILGSTVAICVLVSATQLVAATEFPSRFSEAPAPVTEPVVDENNNAVVVDSHPADMPTDAPAPEYRNVPAEETITAPVAATANDPIPQAEAEAIAKPVELNTEEPRPELLGSRNDDMTKALATAPSAKTDEEALPDDLREAMVHVYRHHPQLLAGRESLKATEEQISLARSDFRPSAYLDYAKGRERSRLGTAARTTSNGDSKGLTVSQPLFSGLSGVAGLKSANQRVKAAEADLIALEQQLLYNVVITYTGVAEAQAVLELNQNNVDVLTRQRDATQVRFDVGELTKTDVAQAESRLANAKASEQQSVGDLAIARADFMRAVGMASPEKPGMPGVPENLPTSISEANSAARNASPVIEAARHREKAFASDINIRRGDILPDVGLEASSRRNSGGGFGTNDSDAITLNVVVPLYQSGAEWARLREASNLASQAKFTTMDTLLAVEQDVTSAWQNFVTAESVITSTKSAVEASTTALDGVRQENEFGVRTVLDVLDAEQELLNSKVNLVRASRNYRIQAYRLLASVGKLTAKELNLAEDDKE